MILALISNPDPILKQADAIRMKKLSLTTLEVNPGFFQKKRKPHNTQVNTIAEKKTFFHINNLTATNRQGNVIKSPTEVIKGAVTLSGSHPREKLWKEITNVKNRIKMLESNPPKTDTTTKSMTEIEEN